MLVVPESINPGWTARTADGAQLTPVTVNGWQQGWVVPAGTSGTVTLTFALQHASTGRASSAAWRCCRSSRCWRWCLHDARRRPRGPGTAVAAQCRSRPGRAVLAVGGVIVGLAGVGGRRRGAGVRYLLRHRPRLCDAVTLGASAGGLILAGAVLSQNPWRSVDGYVGHSAGVQLLALISVGALAASSRPLPARGTRT